MLFLVACQTSCQSPPPAPVAGCSALDPEVCLLPWPSSAFLVADPTTRTGFRVRIDRDAMPRGAEGQPVDPALWNRWDGFSPLTTLVAEFASVLDPSPLPTWHDPGASLVPDSPTVLLDVDTGERVAHFSELESSPEVAAGHSTLYLRPAGRLAERHHYAVAIRGLRAKDGASVAPSAAFRALRDGLPGPLDARRESFERDVFAPLAAAGIARETLQLAWDFRTASGEVAWGDLVAMRDAALAAAGAEGLGCSVSEVVEDAADPEIFRRIEGQITVPNFLEKMSDGQARLARDAAGAPAIQGTALAAFTAIVPRSALPESAPVWVYGHGLFSGRDEVTRDFARETAARGGAIVVATDFTGLTGSDLADVVGAFQDLDRFALLIDRVRQGLIQVLLLPRTILGACALQPAFRAEGRPLAGGAEGYFGNSMGGTLGATLAALSPDLGRYALGVGGIDLPLMMPRATGWPLLEAVFRRAYPSRIDRDLLIAMAGHGWELVEGSFAPHVLSDPLPGSRPARVLLQVGLHDTSTTNIASEIAARTLRLPQLTPTTDPVWGLAAAPAPLESAYVVFDLGAAPLPEGTLAPETDNGVHEAVRRDPRAQAQIVSFLHAGGAVLDTCDGPCAPGAP
jgi:hypothetical protein